MPIKFNPSRVRGGIKAPKRIRKARQDWGVWKDRTLEDPHPDILARFTNRIYSVRVYPYLGSLGPMFVLSVMRHDGRPILRDHWWVMQEIKDDLLGEATEGFELYPPRPEVLDPANIYYMFCLPKGLRLGVGLKGVDNDPSGLGSMVKSGS